MFCCKVNKIQQIDGRFSRKIGHWEAAKWKNKRFQRKKNTFDAI